MIKPGVWLRRLPWLLAAAAVLLVACGWMGLARYDQLAGGSGRLLRQQIVWSALAAVGMLVTTIPSYRTLCRWSYLIFALAVALLVVVYFFPAVNGARRWIRVGAVGFQPSEFAKIALVLALARYLMYGDHHRNITGLVVPLGLTLLPMVLVLREPDLGTAMVFVPVLFVMLFAAGARRRDLAHLALAALVAVPVLWTQMSREQRSRVAALFAQAGPGDRAGPETYQLRQAKQVLALGGLWGSLVAGPPVDDPAAYHLPEAHSDFIFCVLGERFGWPGIAAVLGLFTVLVWRGLAIAQATAEPFGRLVAVGLVALLAVQVLINTAMTVGLLPVTGLSLPLVSYGGSGLLAQGLLLGLLLNIGLRPGYEVAGEPFRYPVD